MHNKELERLQAVDRFLKLKISKEDEMREIAAYAAEICQVPIALITLIDSDTQHIRVGIGTDAKETTRAEAFCNYTILNEGVMVVPDTAKDIRFVNNPLRTGAFNIQFYAGATLTTSDGINLGSLCVIDHKPKKLTTEQQNMLRILSRQVIHILEFDYSLNVLKNQFLEAKKNEIKLMSLFESSPSCQLLLDENMVILYFNKSLSEFMKINHDQDIKIGMHVVKFVGEDFLDNFSQNFKKALSGEYVILEHSLMHGDREIWWQFNYNPAFNLEGKIIGVSYAATDISELKKSQQETIEKKVALDKIAFIQSHEIRRPVSSILGIVSLLKSIDAPETRDEVAMLNSAAHDLDDTIRRVIAQTIVVPE